MVKVLEERDGQRSGSFASSAGSVAVDDTTNPSYDSGNQRWTNIITSSLRDQMPPPTGVLLTAPNPRIKMASRLRSTLIRESIVRLANKGIVQRFQFSCAQDPHSVYLPSKRHCCQPRGIVSACECEEYSGMENTTCREEQLTVARPLAPEIPFLHLNQPDEKSESFAVPVLISISSSPQCRIAVNGPAVAEVIEFHSPSKNGTSRPLRPPCILYAADSSITSLQFSKMA